MQIRENNRPKREISFGLENALAGYVRRQWPDKTIPHVMQAFDLSESEAAKVVYANASKNTLRKLLHHKRGGFALFLELLADACGTTLEDHIQTQAERAANERRAWEAEERRMAALMARVSGAGVEPGGAADAARRRWSKPSDVG